MVFFSAHDKLLVLHHLAKLDQMDIICYSLGTIDLFLCIIAVIQLIRISLNERQHNQIARFVNSVNRPENPTPRDDGNLQSTKWSGKKSFHGVIVACTFVRGVFFCYFPSYSHKTFNFPSSMNILWIQTGDTLFFLAYFMLLLFWADFYYRMNGGQQGVFERLRIPLICLFAFVGIGYVAIFIIAFLSMQNDNRAGMLDDISSLALCLLSLLVSFGFLYYGVKLSIVIQNYRLASTRKKTETRKIVGVAVFCTICFATRACFVTYTIIDSWEHFKNNAFNAPWEMSLFFFLCLETFPIATILFLLRKLPKAKPSGTTSPLLHNAKG